MNAKADDRFAKFNMHTWSRRFYTYQINSIAYCASGEITKGKDASVFILEIYEAQNFVARLILRVTTHNNAADRNHQGSPLKEIHRAIRRRERVARD